MYEHWREISIVFFATALFYCLFIGRIKKALGLYQVRSAEAFVADQEKFSTQRNVTYFLLGLFASTSGLVMYQDDQSERSMILQTIINLTLLAVGYWLGASKQGQDQAQAMNQIAAAAPAAAKDAQVDAKEAAAKAVNLALAARTGTTPADIAAPAVPPATDPAAPIVATNVDVKAETATVVTGDPKDKV